MSTAWKNAGKMGSVRLMLLMRWITLHLGRPCSRLCLTLIVAYYFLLTRKGKRASKQFLEKALNRPVTAQDLCRHFWSFANTILDRVYMVSDKTELLSVEVINADIALKQLAKGQGCIMLGSHLGSFEILRCLGQQLNNLPLKVVMDTGPNEQFNRHLYALNPEIRDCIINASAPDSIFKIQEALDQKSMIGILGDRVMAEGRVTLCDFLGQSAKFPTGPLLMSSIFQIPVILFFGVYLGGNRYRIIFELFSEKVITHRASREQDINAHVQHYAARLEYYARQYPYNWFNYYDFWK